MKTPNGLLKPVVDKFLFDVEAIIQKQKEIKKSLEAELNKTEELNKSLLEQQRESKARMNEKLKDLETKISKQRGINKICDVELDKYIDKNKEISTLKINAESILKDAQAERGHVSRKTEELEKHIKDYQSKVASLKVDFDKLEKTKNDLSEVRRILKAKNVAITRREEILIEDTSKLSQKEIKLNAKIKKIELVRT